MKPVPTKKKTKPAPRKRGRPPKDGVAPQGERDRLARTARASAAGIREIGTIPDIVDPERRESCLSSLRLFCDTYNPEAFNLPWSDTQLESLARIEEVVKYGSYYAFAEARGSGKTSRVRMAALWAISNALCRYGFIISATDSKAADTLEALKTCIRFLPTYTEDFPEIAYPIQRLAGIANRTAGQTCDGESTCIAWTADRIVLPTVPPPSNWPKHWELRSDGMVPTSGAVFSTSGLTGEGIRGSLKTLTTGEQVRPDLVLLDDPQTAESAGSLTQNEKREHLISADVLGMAGPGKKLGVVLPCTIIAPGDAMDRMTNRCIHPLWRGNRSGILSDLPDDMAAWDDYFEVYHRCAQKEPPDYDEANAYYLANRVILDAGASATWPARKLPGEVSATQSAMNIYCRDRRAFLSEYMNRPEPIDLGALNELQASEILKKLNGTGRGVVPADATRLTAFVDCGSELLFWCVVGWSETFSGVVIDYGTFPAQTRSYFAADDARPKLSDLPAFRNMNEEARVYAGLRETVAHVLSKSHPRASGGTETVSRCLVDSGNWSKTVGQFCQASAYRPLLRASKGWGTSGGAPMANWPVQPGERRPGDHWRDRVNKEGSGRLITFDANHWKSFVARALQAPERSAGCLTLFGDRGTDHRLFADHLCAEYQSSTVAPLRGDQTPQTVWRVRPDNRDNHWWDCLVGCAVAASVLGVSWDSGVAAGESPRRAAERRVVRMSEIYAAKHGSRDFRGMR